MPSFAQPVPSFATATAFLSVAGEPLVGLEINVVGHDQHFYKKKIEHTKFKVLEDTVGQGQAWAKNCSFTGTASPTVLLSARAR